MHSKAYLKGGEKMDEYLSREFVLSCVDDFLSKTDMPIAAQFFYDCFREGEAADVQPVKHGRWIGINEYCKKNGYIPSGMSTYYWCSECDKAEQKTSDFCPNCGAIMYLKEGENNAD